MDKTTFTLLYKAMVRLNLECANAVWYPYKRDDTEIIVIREVFFYVGFRAHVKIASRIVSYFSLQLAVRKRFGAFINVGQNRVISAHLAGLLCASL